jgi:hypothetical protein
LKVLSFDPGGDTGAGATGWCYQDENKVYAMDGVQNLKEFLKNWNLEKLPVDHVVVEGYMINPRQGSRIAANIGKRLVTVEHIGAAEMWAHLNDIPTTIYPNTLKKTQQKHSGVLPPKRKDIEHKFDAFNHGWWKLYQEGLVLTKLEQQMKAEGKL